MPDAAKRVRQTLTTPVMTPTSRAIAREAQPSAASRTIRARRTMRCSVVDARSQPSSSLRVFRSSRITVACRRTSGSLRGRRSSSGKKPDVRRLKLRTSGMEFARAFACWMVFFVLTALSLWCAYGTTATQFAEKFANQAVASTAQSSRETTLERLRKQRDALTFTETSAEAVKTAQDAVSTATEQAAAKRSRGGCRDLCRQREAEERTAPEALLKAQENRAATIMAAELDSRIAAAKDALS